MQPLHRHRVEHFVADDDGLDAFGQLVEPAHPVGPGRERAGLALAQGAAEVDDGVAAHTVTQGLQQLRRQRATAGAEFDDLVRAGGFQQLRHLPRKRRAEKR